MSTSLRPYGLYSPWNSPGQNTGVGSSSLLRGIFSNQESNPGFPHCRWILYQLSYKGSPRILEWVAYSFSKRSSQPRNQTGVSCIAGGLFTNWASRKSLRSSCYGKNIDREQIKRMSCTGSILSKQKKRAEVFKCKIKIKKKLIQRKLIATIGGFSHLDP